MAQQHSASPDSETTLRRRIATAPIAQLPELGVAAMRGGAHEVALSAFVRLERALGTRTPPAVLGLQATCLHQLGRYREADALIVRGLGDSAQTISPPPAFEEHALLARWANRTTPVVSIICTTYNHERYIAQALQGFVSQDTSYPFEILVHDDASTDRTAEIIREWQARYPHLIRATLQTENQFKKGVRPFELMLGEARGEYIAVCEGDDYWVAANKLQEQVSFLEQHPEFSCCAHNYYHFAESSLAIRPWIATREARVFTQRQLMGIARLFWLPTLVFRRRFDSMPPERALAPIGDQFLTAYLGTFGPGMYFESLMGAVRRENAYSTWSPLDPVAKERIRVRTWMAVVRMHAAAGRDQAVADVLAKVAASSLPDAEKQTLITECLMSVTSSQAA